MSVVEGVIESVVGAILRAVLTRIDRRRLPEVEGKRSLDGLRAPAEVIRDRWGVPHIYADNERDLFFAQGFVHAQDRLWQMDFVRRLVAGRLSEVFGAGMVPVDRWVRILGLRRVIEQEVSLVDASILAVLESYAAGVNACIAQGRLPVEFTLLRYRPEPWTPADTLSWVKLMSWSLSVHWSAKFLRARLIDCMGPEQAAELELGDSGEWSCILPPDIDYSAIGGVIMEQARFSQAYLGPAAGDGVGSNAWVIAGSRTASGAPLLAHDMHLAMLIPSVWYENHLEGRGFGVTGVTLPGVPGVVAGHNGRVAWGFTNSCVDAQDLYVERLRRVDDGSGHGRVQYEYKGEWLDAEVIREEIRVRGGKTVVEEVAVTRHGPVISGLVPDSAGGQSLALRWTPLEPDSMIESLHRMNHARNCREFREALRFWVAPSQNVVYADVEGNIAYSLTGKIPIRDRGNGLVPVPGWTGEYEWGGYIPFEELPHLYNPPREYIATANNCVVDDDGYPYYLGREYCLGDRAQRIAELIEGRGKIDVAYVRQMQFDQVSPTARAIAGYLGQLTVDDPDLAAVVALMRDWDGALAVDGAAGAVYEVFVRRMVDLMLEEAVGDLAAHCAGEGVALALVRGDLLGERVWGWLRRTLADPNSHWFDLGQGQTRDACVALALRQTVDFLRAELGSRMEDWAWGKLHTLTYSHLLGRTSLLIRIFNRGPYPVGGDSTTLWATATSQHGLSCESLVGPPFRFVADLGDLRNTLGLLAPGQSGRLASRHYDDQAEAWFTGAYHPMHYAREDVEREAEVRLRLEPRADFDTWLFKVFTLRRTGRRSTDD